MVPHEPRRCALGIRLILSDMDDTLLRSDGSISAANVAAIDQARAKGIHFCAATGRMHASAALFLEPAQLADEPLISCNGALVQNLRGGEVLCRRYIDVDVAREVVTYAREREIYAQCYLGDTYVFAEECEFSRNYAKGCGIEGRAVGALGEYLNELCSKILLIVDSEIAVRCVQELKARYPGRLAVARSKPYFVEICHPEAQKGIAAQAVAQHFGVPPEEVLAIGDGENDVSLIQWAGTGVAVGNASAALKDCADAVVATNDEDGFAEAVRRFCLN